MDRYSSLRTGLVGAWCPSLGESGYIVRDRSGRGNNATLNAGVSNVARQGGTALTFNGTSGIATLGKASFVGLNIITVSYWFRRATTSDGVGVQQGNTDANRMLFGGGTAGDNNIYVGGNFSTGLDLSYLSLSGFGVNTWHHFVGTMVMSDPNYGTRGRIWINGVQRTLTFFGNSGTTVVPAFTTFADIGERFTGSGTGWRGADHDDIRIYNRALTLAEIRLLASQRGIGLIPVRHRRGSLLSQFWLNVAGTWKAAKPWVNVGGTWRQGRPKIRAGGAWKG